MRAIALLLACLACAGHGSREKEDKKIQDGSHAERSTTPSSHSLAELEQSQSIARGGASKPMKFALPMLLLALKDPADAFAPHATMPGVREVRSDLQFPAAPNFQRHPGFLPDAGLFDDEDPAIQKSKFSSTGLQPQQQQRNEQLVERRVVLSSVLAALALLNAPKPTFGAARAAVTSFQGNHRDLSAEEFMGLSSPNQEQVRILFLEKELESYAKLKTALNELIAELREAEDMTPKLPQKDLKEKKKNRKELEKELKIVLSEEVLAQKQLKAQIEDMVDFAKRKIADQELQIEAFTWSSPFMGEYPNQKLKDQDLKQKKNERKILQQELELLLKEEARVQKKFKVQFEAPQSPS